MKIDLRPAPLPCAGFAAGPAADGRQAAQACFAAASDGRYRLRVTLRAQQDVPDALLFSNERRLVWRGALRAGEAKEITALTAVHPTLSDLEGQRARPRGAQIALVADGVRILAASAEPADVPAVLMMGDSTVTDQTALSPYAPGATYAGWGQMLSLFLGENACAINFAYSGLTVETICERGLYGLLRKQLRPGDVVLIQFGHNDQKRMHLTADGGYADALRAFVSELRALGAVPVLVTPLARNSWWNEAQYADLLAAFAASSARVAQETGAPLIDLHAHFMGVLTALGRDAAKPLFHIGDYTHTNDFGAHLAARFIAGALSRLGLCRTADDGEWIPHGPYDVPADDQGDEALPPSALEQLYARFETERPDEALTQAEAVSLVCRTCMLFAHNAPAVLPPDIAPDAPCAEDVRCAVQHGLLPWDADAPFDAQRAIRPGEFLALVSRGVRMRIPLPPLPVLVGETVSRALAAALCRRFVF